MFDTIIKNAEVIDGTGSEPYTADVAIKDGKIAKIGNGLEGNKIIDATGLVLTPGFIDSHSHSDRSLIDFPNSVEKVEQGITFSIGGMCGNSATPVTVNGKLETAEEFFNKFEGIHFGSGIAILIGHNTIRRAIMGTENRFATAEDLDKMKSLLRESLRAGAIGISFGLFYTPGCYSDINECIELAKVVAKEKGIITAHIRNESDNLLEAVEEFITIIKASGCRAVFSHHKAAGKQNWGKIRESVAMVERAIEEGCDIYFDAYPYTASSTTLISRFLPKKYHPEGITRPLDLLENPEARKAIKEDERKEFGNDLSWTLVVTYPQHREYEGLNVNEIADREGEDDRLEMAYKIISDTNGTAQGCFFTMCEEDVEYILSHPKAMICTDSSVGKGRKQFHPRLRAAFVRALAHYTRDRKIVPLTEMIRRMTSLPAYVYGLDTKGIIREGMDADLCIFNYEKLSDNADYINPTAYNEGLEYVLINGQVVVENNRFNNSLQAILYRKPQNN